MQTFPLPTRVALHNILFATDFSDASRAALLYALELVRWYDGMLFLTHVVAFEPYLGVPFEPTPLEPDFLWRREQKNMADFLDTIRLNGVAHQEILRRGELWDTISDVVHEKQIDLVVVGTHGRRGFSKLVLGSAAERIYRQAKCPVLTVGPSATDKRDSDWSLKQILFPTDFSEASLHALPLAQSLAEENQAKLIFLNFVPLLPIEDVEKDVHDRLNALIPEEPWYNAEFMVRTDFPATGIVRLARERQADLIVMGVGKPAPMPLGSHLPWSIASDVVRQAPCPVLTVRG